jgi:hypothetical protein
MSGTIRSYMAPITSSKSIVSSSEQALNGSIEIDNYITQIFINSENNANSINNTNNKYIILYIDREYNNYDIEISKYLTETYNIKIIKFLLNNEEKKILNTNFLYEIYTDNYTEEYLINNCFFIIYLSKIKRSDNLINLLNKNNKNVYIKSDKLIISSFKSDQDLDEFKDTINEFIKNISDSSGDNFIQKNFENFKKYYEFFENDKNILIKKNISLNFNKINNITTDDINNKNICIVTYYKNYDFKILNIIQKKCIIENIKNKNVNEIFIIGEKLENELTDIMDEYKNINKKITFYEYNKELSFKDLIDIINNKLNNKLICLLRSDIILPNQNDLDELKFEIFSTEINEIYSLSRIERLVNGDLIKNNNLNKVLSSTEQDGWIFMSPININLESLENVYFYNKHSELYFNKLLKNNNYNLINNTSKYKIIRVLYENNLDNRLLLKNNILNFKNNDDIFLLPENNLIDKISLDNLVKLLNLDSNEIYKIKCIIFNKYFKNIIN